MTDSWFNGLLQAPHEPGLSRALSQVGGKIEKLVGHEHKDSFEIIHELRDELKTGSNLALEAGRRWARMFLPKQDLEKSAGFFDWDLDRDISKIIAGIHEEPSPSIHAAVHEALSSGLHPQHVVGKLLKTHQVDRARDIARTVMMNIYTKGSLREMSQHGYTEAIRMEINDHKVCCTCKGLNNKVYAIAAIVDLPDPLTADSHPRCRGTFVPVINPILTTPDASMKHVSSFMTRLGKAIENVPNEFAMFLKRFFQKQPIPFDVVFDPKLSVDSRMGTGILRINPKTLVDQDPREVVLESWAHKLWPKYKDVFENEYLLMTRMGLVHPSKTVKTSQDFWMSEFVAYKTNQLEQPYENLWFRSTVKE